MQKIKYIIIFVLLVALGMFYTQIVDYQSITNSLLKENQTHNTSNDDLNEEILTLKNQVVRLKQQIKTLEAKVLTAQNEKIPLNEKIIALEEELLTAKVTRHKESYLKPETNYKKELNTELNYDTKSLNIPTQPKSSLYNGPDLSPSVDLNENREVTGAGIEYKTTF